MKRLMLYPFLFSLYPVLALLAHNAGEVRFEDALRSVFIILVLMGLLLMVYRFFLGCWQKAAVLTSVSTLLFLSYGHIYHGLKEGFPIVSAVFRHRYLIPLNIVILSLVYVQVRRRRQIADLTLYLNIMSVLLVIYPVLQIIQSEFAFNRAQHTSTTDPSLCHLSFPEGTDPPDIYYIILDAYARKDVLADTYEFDNQPFLDELVRRGFYIANWSQSNYARTGISLGSSLNFSYYTERDGEYVVGEGLDHEGILSIGNNLVRKELGCLGYSTIAFDSGYYWSGWRDADYFLSPNEKSFGDLLLTRVNAFEAMLIHNSGGLILKDTATLLSEDFNQAIESPFWAHRERVLFAIDRTGNWVPHLESPKFVFVHIVSPHPPYVFGLEGDGVTFEEPFTFIDNPDTEQTEIIKYRAQVLYLNTEILEMIDKILEFSSRPPIIIIQGDHGIGRGIRDRMSILNAYYLPDGGSQDLYETISPVNTFRVIFNYYLGGNYALLEDKSFFSEYDSLFDFTEFPNKHVVE